MNNLKGVRRNVVAAETKKRAGEDEREFCHLGNSVELLSTDRVAHSESSSSVSGNTTIAEAGKGESLPGGGRRARPINIPTHWHQLPQARAIISRLQEGELRKISRTMSTCDVDVFHGLTARATRHLDRLTALRRDAINAAVGHTMQQALDRKDRAMAEAHAHTDWETPTVFDVLVAVFADRRAADLRRAA